MSVNILDAAKNLFCRYEKERGVIDNYFGLLAYYALVQLAQTGGDQALMKKCKDYLSLYYVFEL